MNTTLAVLIDKIIVEGAMLPQERFCGTVLSPGPFNIFSQSSSHEGGTPSIPYMGSKVN